jgi:5-methylcytosine-specific restriction endonuclease McrA
VKPGPALIAGFASKEAEKSLDHLDPIKHGGVHGISNVAICCRSCNCKKHDRPFAKWLDRLPERQRATAERLYRRVKGL